VILPGGDQGENAFPPPDLVAIISQAHPAAHKLHRAQLDGRAAISGLCRLGPTASSALPSLIAFVKDGTLPPDEFGDNLPFTLMRLGMPTDAAIEHTKSSSRHDRFLNTDLSDKDTQRDCG
jgi:hypothetical protein